MKTVITLAGSGSATVTDRRSEFIGYAVPVSSEQEATEFVAGIKKKHADARHNVFAYVLRGGAVKRYSDDGEPQGSAGMPVLDVLVKSGLDDVAVVVTRYFGGILLGTGGLVRAYSSAAAAAIENAGVVTLRECARLKVTMSYNDHSRIGNDLKRAGASVVDTAYGENVELTVTVPETERESLCERLTELTAGRANVAVDGSVMAPVPEE